jgi:ATP-dependent Clp protease protease subunit
MPRLAKESIDRFFDYSVHVESRTLFVGDGGDGEIDADAANRVIMGFHLLTEASKEKPIAVYINSFGGCWFNGMAIFDVIKSCPCPVTAYVLGAAMSMGSIILQAADERIIYPNGTIMVHDGYESRTGDIPQTFVNWAEYSKKTRNSMYRIYADRSGKPVSFWRRKCAADLILTAQEAKALGLVDSIYGETGN